MLPRPLKDRMLRSHQSISYISSSGTGRPQKYKDYEEWKLYKAYEEVLAGRLSIRRAAAGYGVPTNTLCDRVTGKVSFGSISGPQKYLTDNEEKELVTFIMNAAAVGYGYSRKQVIELVQDVVEQKGNHDIKVTHGWWDSFRRQHPEITLRRSEPLSYIRATASHPDVLEKYFEELECTLSANEILDKPSLIFNMDESGFPLDPKNPFIVCRRGERHPSFITSGSKVQITVLACCNAAGYAIPPLVIFDRKILKPELTFGEVPGTMYGLSSSGWIDSEIFDGWFQNHFLAYAPGSRPILLLLDGHSAHFNPVTIRKAAEEKVIIFCLPPHTTHKTQPLDKGCFSPLKSYWKDECNNYLRRNPGKVITRFQFSEIFAKAWSRGMTITNVVNGFKTTGIFPFNPRQLIPEKSIELSPISFCRETGLKYIPLYSPSPSLKYRPQSRTATFSEEEMIRYQRRFEDIPDERYEMWLKLYHPVVRESTPLEDVTIHLSHSSSMSQILSQKSLEIKVPDTSHKTTARVLTSIENLQILEEKKKKKEAELKLKNERKLEREKKRIERTLGIVRNTNKSKVNCHNTKSSDIQITKRQSSYKVVNSKASSEEATSEFTDNEVPVVGKPVVRGRGSRKTKSNEDNELANEVPVVGKPVVRGRGSRKTKSNEDNELANEVPVVGKPVVRGRGSRKTKSNEDNELANEVPVVGKPVVRGRGSRKTKSNEDNELANEVPVVGKPVVRGRGSRKTKSNEDNELANEVPVVDKLVVCGRGSRKTKPNEGTYCWCGGDDIGKMVACDNEKCIREWFHFECVGLVNKPKGSWYCSKFCKES